MALREAQARVLFSGGIETKTDPKAVPPTKLLVLQNGVFGRGVSIQKRNGYEAIDQAVDGTPVRPVGAIRLAARGDELLEFTRDRCYSLQADVGQWSDVGAVMSVAGTDRPLVKTGTQQLQPDHASLGGVTAVAWEDSLGGVWWSVVDATSERIYRAPTQADAAGVSPRCVAAGPNLHIYYAVPAQRRVMVLVIRPDAPGAAVTPAILIDDLDATNSVYDACPTGRPGTPAVIAWLEHATSNVRLGYVDASGQLGGPSTGHPTIVRIAAGMQSGSPLGVAFGDIDGADNDRIAVAYVAAPSLAGRVTILSGGDSIGDPIDPLDDIDGHITTSTQRVAVAIEVAAASPVIVTAWEEAAAQPSNRFTVVDRYDTASAALAISIIRSVGLASRAFAVDGRAFAAFVHDTTFFNVYLTLRLTDGLVVGRHVPGSAAGAPARKHLPSAQLSAGVVSIALPVRDRLLSENGDKFTETGLRLLRIDFAHETSHQAARLGRGLYLAGACPQHYDGRAWTEQGFHVGPELISTVAAGGGALTSTTTYEYRAWYEWTDFQGEVHRGPTSIGALVVMGGGDTQVTLTLPTLRVTGKTNVRICVARSFAAKTGKTAQLFRVTSLDPSTAGAPNGYVASSKSIDSVVFVDRMSDAELALQEEIYTDGGILSNDPSPLGPVVTRGQNRLFFTDPSNGNLIRYSQRIDDGYGVEIPPELSLPVDPFGGDVTALAFQDGRGVVWKAGAIFVFSGDGPTPSGDTANSGFTAPELVTSDVGCIEPASVVLTPNGHMFQSAKGIYMLGRDGAVSYVGSPVEAYNGQRIRRATVLPDRTQVVFLTDAGVTLLYDYLFGQWSTFTNHTGYDAAVVSSRYHYLRTDGRVFRETLGRYSDAGTRIRLRLETAWIHLAPHLQGFQRFWYLHLLGTWISPHQLGVQYQTDYTPGWSEADWLDATGLTSSSGWITGPTAGEIGLEPIAGSQYGDGEYGDGPYGGIAPGLYEWRVQLNEKGQSIRFRLEDFEADGFAGASFELTEMLLTGGIKDNAPRPFTKARSS